MSDKVLRVHQFLPYSQANGPGNRAVIWVQGCTLGCPGCFNPETHPDATDKLMKIDELFEKIIALKDTIEGLTISGGEPLQQRPAVADLLSRIKQETTLSVVLFTGFSWQELERIGAAHSNEKPTTGDLPLALLQNVDVLIAGRYQADLRIARDLRGSSNKTTYFLTNRYDEAAMAAIPPAEVVITETGEIIMSGIDPLKW